jgi:hypothetical protein
LGQVARPDMLEPTELGLWPRTPVTGGLDTSTARPLPQPFH